jgi:hypothetical protein
METAAQSRDFAAAGSPGKEGFLLLKHPRFREVINSPLPTLVVSVNGCHGENAAI